MLLATAAVAAIAYWDEQREFGAALNDFADEQALLAQTLSHSLGAGLGANTADKAATPEQRLQQALQHEPLISALRSLEKPPLVRLLWHSPGHDELTRSDGSRARSRVIEAALAADAPWVRLSREEAAALGLPARMAMVGLSRIDTSDGRFGVAVVASAKRERDRERLAEWRLISSVLVASGLVLAFGGAALRNQRKQLALEHELAVAAMQSERDERLVRADKLATMGALATGIAHEVSTPLGVILGRAEQLRARSDGDERWQRAVGTIIEQADRINGIIRGFLALVRGDAPRLERVSPSALASVALDLVEHRFTKAGVALSHAFAANLPDVACGPRLIEQVLVNLLLNACDACSAGGQVELNVLAEGGHAAFIVTDDGTGISADAAARLMEPFFTTKPAGAGSGLGLAIASELVKHHRGTLTVAARPDHSGTRARVELPTVSEPAP